MIVMKFGGTSMGSADSIAQYVIPIIERSLEKKPLVVVSAMSGVTSGLLAIGHRAVQQANVDLSSDLQAIELRHIEAARQLILDSNQQQETITHIEKEMNDLEIFLNAIETIGELSDRSYDILMAVGEKLSALLLSGALKGRGYPAEYVNLEHVISKTPSYESDAYWDEVLEHFKARFESLESGVVPVATGFFGPTAQGILKSVGRGYSDFCASLVGAAMHVEEIQIWTDVDGVLSTNPKVVPEAFLLDQISFDEMSELAHFGAKVLHPHSVRPAVLAQIPIRILNTFNSQCPGTLVVEEKIPTRFPFKSIAYKKGVTLIRIVTPKMLMAHGFIAQVGQFFERHKISMDLIATSEVSVSMSVEEPIEALQGLLKDLSTLGEVTTQENQSIICLVGTEMQNHSSSIFMQIFEPFHRYDIPIRMISLGDALINFSLVVDDAHCEQAVQQLHHSLFSSNAKIYANL